MNMNMNTATAATAATRKRVVETAGLQKALIGRGEAGITRNGVHCRTLGALVEMDAHAEAKGLHRAPHGCEADVLAQHGFIDEAAAIAAARAASNGRNVFWEGGPGGAASSPREVQEIGPAASRSRAFERKSQWGDFFPQAIKFNFGAACRSPQEYATTGVGQQWFRRNPDAAAALDVTLMSDEDYYAAYPGA